MERPREVNCVQTGGGRTLCMYTSSRRTVRCTARFATGAILEIPD